MNEKLNMPPTITYADILRAAYVVKQEEEYKAHIIFLSKEVSDKIEQELKDIEMTFDKFIHRSCIDFLLKQQLKKKEMQDYLNFNDLRITQEAVANDYSTWSYSESSSNADSESISKSLEAPKQASQSGSGGSSSSNNNDLFCCRLK